MPAPELRAGGASLQALWKRTPAARETGLHYAQLLEAEGERELALEANERCLTLDRQCGEAWARKRHVCFSREATAEHRDALKAATHAVALEAGGVDGIFLKAELSGA